MILVDSSVWIGHLRNQDTTSLGKFRAIEDTDSILVGDLILLEVLQGARDERQAVRIEHGLRQFRVVQMLNDSVAVRAARNYRTLRGKGVTVRKTVDVIIATFCIENRYALLQSDRDFAPFAQHLGLSIA
jgi:predicted nucleic acid-binding protein